MSEGNDVTQYIEEKNLKSLFEKAVNECYSARAENPEAFLAQFFTNLSSEPPKPNAKITKVVGRQVLDSRGNPTVEADVYVKFGQKEVLVGREAAPSGASTGSNEARELRDKDAAKYMGKGTTTAVGHVSNEINKALQEADVTDLRGVDQRMRTADGTELKEVLGGNALTAVSFAAAAAGAHVKGVEMYEHFAEVFGNQGPYSLPRPLVNILNGGKHAGGKLKIQEFMVMPDAKLSYSEGLRQVTEIYHHLHKVLIAKYGASASNVGDEGGFAPALDTPDQALKAIEEAIVNAGYLAGPDAVSLALDCAASEFYDSEKQRYEITQGKWVSTDELLDFYEKLFKDHPALISVEDALDEKDYEGWAKFTAKFGDKLNVVGDDLYTTNTNLIARGIENKWANTLLLKVNQIGTISESMDAAKMMFDAGQKVVVSHRSGETTGSVIADLAVGIGAGYIKTGATARGERVCKYNRLLFIEEDLRKKGKLAE